MKNSGMWRSWLARTAGGREVAGSSPAIPTIYSSRRSCILLSTYESANTKTNRKATLGCAWRDIGSQA